MLATAGMGITICFIRVHSETALASVHQCFTSFRVICNITNNLLQSYLKINHQLISDKSNDLRMIDVQDMTGTDRPHFVKTCIGIRAVIQLKVFN